jgi:hypothetical protein
LSAAQIPRPPTKEKTMADYSGGLQGGMNAAVPTKSETTETMIASLQESLSILSTQSERVADRLGGTQPTPISNAKEPGPTNILSKLRELRRTISYITDNLNRAENYLG